MTGQAPVAKLPHLVREAWRALFDRPTSSWRRCAAAVSETRMRASTTTALSGRPMHGVEVQLGEFREVVGEPREPVEDVRERGGIRGCRAAENRR